MENIKRGYKKAKGKVKDLLRPVSRQSALSTPARSPRSSQEPSARHGQGVSTTTSVIELASQTAIVPTAIVTPIADLPALEVSAPEPLPEPEHAPNATSTYAQSASAMHDQGITTIPSAVVPTNQTVIASTPIAMHAADDPALEAPAPKQFPQLERTRDGARPMHSISLCLQSSIT